MNIGEDFLALVALEEAMYIRMQNCEEGDDETVRYPLVRKLFLHESLRK